MSAIIKTKPHFQAIEVKYMGPTNTIGARYKAYADAGFITLAADNGLNPSQNAERAAIALANKMGWDGAQLHGGTIPNGHWVFTVSYED